LKKMSFLLTKNKSLVLISSIERICRFVERNIVPTVMIMTGVQNELLAGSYYSEARIS